MWRQRDSVSQQRSLTSYYCQCGSDHDPGPTPSPWYSPEGQVDVPAFCANHSHPSCLTCRRTTASPNSLQILACQAILFEPDTDPKEWRRWPGKHSWVRSDGKYRDAQWTWGEPFPTDDLADFLRRLPLPEGLRRALLEYYVAICLNHYSHPRRTAAYGRRCMHCCKYRALKWHPTHVIVGAGSSPPTPIPRPVDVESPPEWDDLCWIEPPSLDLW